MDKKISIIIVSFNSEKFIESCVSSLLEYLPKNSEIIVVDNASTDSTSVILKKFGSRIQLIKSNENLGFSKANNLGAKKATGEYLFILNPDTQLIEQTVEELVKFYESKSNVGIVSPKLIMPDNSTQPSVMNLPSIMNALKEFIFKVKSAYLPYVPKMEEPIKVECVFAAAWLVKKDIFEKLKGFNEKYFLYYEDIDFCQRLKQNNLAVYYYPQVKVKHIVGGVQDESKGLLNRQSANLYHGSIQGFILQLIFRIGRLIPA